MFELTLATAVVAGFVLLKGILVLACGEKFCAWGKTVLYGRAIGIVVWSLAVIWTLWEVTKLGPADFGSFKVALFFVFLGLGISSVWMLKDYLFVRGAAVLALFVSWWLLKAAYLRPEWTRLIYVAVVYVIVVAALYFAVAPWRMCDIVVSLEKNKLAQKIVGGWYVALGLVLVGVAASYRFV